MEVWKDIKGFKKLYQVSNLGRVKSLTRTVDDGQGGERTVRKRILKHGINGGGYAFVVLCKKGKPKAHSIHRLMGSEFIPNPLNKRCINHLNGIKTDNTLPNLEWSTHKENMVHSFKNGFHKPLFGQKNGNSKLSPLGVYMIKENEGLTNTELGEVYGVTPENIGAIKKGLIWKHIELLPKIAIDENNQLSFN